MAAHILNSLKMLLLLTLLTGVAYPLGITGIATVAFPFQAQGSLLTDGQAVIGSRLIGQNFTLDKYFQGRPSAAGDDGYDAVASSGSNLGPTNGKLAKIISENAAKVRAANQQPPTVPVPADLITASASGLDPHISPAAANYQIKRVAKARNLSEGDVASLVERYTEGPQLTVLGESRVNVLLLNQALDRL